MSRITVLDSPTVTLWYYPETKIVHHELHQFIYGEDFKQLLMTGAGLIKEHGAQKWLSDDRKNTVLAQRDPSEEWVRENFILPTIRAGWKHWAIVWPEKVLGQMSMQRVSKEHMELGLTVELFHDPVEAMAWLEKQ